MDETCACSHEPNLKCQSNEWKHPSSPHPKKVHATQCAVKETFIVAYDTDGIYSTILPTTAHSCSTTSSALRRKRRQLVVQNLVIFHDNARSHTTAAVTNLLRRWKWVILEHPPYSPHVSNGHCLCDVTESIRSIILIKEHTRF